MKHLPLSPATLFAILGSCVVALVLGGLTGCSSPHHDGHGEGEPGAVSLEDETARIQKWQQDRDAKARDRAMSPFGAVDSHYVNEGLTVTLGAGDSGLLKDPEPPAPAMATITYDEEAGFTIDRLPESAPPRLHELETNGEPSPLGDDLEGTHVLGEDEIASLGRYFLAMSPQSGFGRIIAYDPEAEAKTAFEGFRWYPADVAFQVMAKWVPNPQPDEVTIATSRGLAKTFHRAGHFQFTVDGESQALVALAESSVPKPGDSLFLPFRDATTGKETYEIGRYLDVDFLGEEKEHLIDFNLATNPLCNYSPHFNCPLPPEENRLTVAIRAGEMTYPVH